jgi:hypothetical protein
MHRPSRPFRDTRPAGRLSRLVRASLGRFLVQTPRVTEGGETYDHGLPATGAAVLHRENVVSRDAAGTLATIGVAVGTAGLVIGVSSGIYGGLSAVALGLPLLGLGAIMTGVGLLFSVCRVVVTPRYLYVHFGWVRRQIRLDAIQHAGVAAAWAMPHGKVQIGVDGVTRTSVGRAASKRGVEISYYEGGRPHVIQVGSENPERLAYIIERARKPALGR